MKKNGIDWDISRFERTEDTNLDEFIYSMRYINKPCEVINVNNEKIKILKEGQIIDLKLNVCHSSNNCKDIKDLDGRDIRLKPNTRFEKDEEKYYFTKNKSFYIDLIDN